MALHPRQYCQLTCTSAASSVGHRGIYGLTMLVTWRSVLYAHEIDLLSSATFYIPSPSFHELLLYLLDFTIWHV